MAEPRNDGADQPRRRKLVLNKETLQAIDPGRLSNERMDACTIEGGKTSNLWWCTGGSDPSFCAWC